MNSQMSRYFILPLLFAWSLTVSAPGALGAERVYFIAAEEVVWDYAPSFPINAMTGKPFREGARSFLEKRPDRIGRKYLKAQYREYSDASFSTRRKKPDHLGLLGPILRAEVGDTIIVHFFNRARFPLSVHPHGVFYDKASEGASYADGTSGKDKTDGIVPPGASFTYRWSVPERAGPGPADPSSIAWPYHSHVETVADTNAGLFGVIIVTARGRAGPDAKPIDVDREFVTLFAIYDENSSLYRQVNRTRFLTTGIEPENGDFIESNLMHSINGLLWGNLKGLAMRVGERVRWHVLAMGSEVDLHTPHWHGATLLMAGRRVDVMQLMPAATRTLDMRPDVPGTWMYHCHVNDHIKAGMMAMFRVNR